MTDKVQCPRRRCINGRELVEVPHGQHWMLCFFCKGDGVVSPDAAVRYARSLALGPAPTPPASPSK